MKSAASSATYSRRWWVSVGDDYGLSEHDRKNIGGLIAGRGDWFSARLLRLIAKADRTNLERLRLGFPEHVAAFEAWRDEPLDRQRPAD
jgi:hypothetical protein